MLVCPNCKYEYVKGITICPDCGEYLVDSASLIQPELAEKDWMIIYSSDQEYEVQMLKDNLSSADIDSIIFSKKDRNFPTPGDMSVINLIVKKKQAEDAAEFINKILKS